MEFRHIETFIAVATFSSFRKAAEHLNLTQSTVSAQIKTLEERLGTVLFNRFGRGIGLTGAGEELLVHGRSLLNMRDEVKSRLAAGEDPSCTLRIRMPQSLGLVHLPEIMARFHDCHPRVGLDIGDCAFSELPSELRSGLTDVGFLLADSIPFPDLKTELLGEAKLTFVRSMQSKGTVLTWEDLARDRLFLPKHDCSYKMMLEAELKTRKIEIPGLVEMNSLCSLLACVARGIGLALVPKMCLNETVNNGVRPVALEDAEFHTGILMITHSRKFISAELECFLDLCRKVVRNR
ncbi:MAG: LysR family transcriptional regulator [Deltaproteobacteria bacterium]|nr:LysR family transcriptional regulator [Deltaproteobacteria bacterium]